MSSATLSPLSTLLSATPLDPSIQKHLRHVYTTLLFAVLLATSGALLDLYSPLPLGTFAIPCTLPALLWFSFSAPHSKSRTYAFHLFAFLDGLAAGPLISLAVAADPYLPLLAFVGAAVVFAGFSVSALFAKRRSYLALGAFLWTGLWGLVILGFINMFTKSVIGFGPMLYGGLMLMCGFVLYDTQLIVEKASRGDRDHVNHAMDLLIDFVGIFKRLLIIMLRNQQRKAREQDKRRRRD